MQIVKALLETRAEIDRLKADLKRLEVVERQQKDQALEYFAETGLEKVSIDGKTVYTMTKVWARVPDLEQALPAIESAGLGWMVKPTINTNTLSGWYREQLETDQDIPQALKDVLLISDSPDIAIRKI